MKAYTGKTRIPLNKKVYKESKPYKTKLGNMSIETYYLGRTTSNSMDRNFMN